MAAAQSEERKRTRFDVADDLCLVQAVCKHEPFAAEHGSKIHVWEKVALETQLHADAKNARISGRAVSDRFRLLMRLHKNGTLRVKHRTENNAETVDATCNALDALATRMDEIKLKGNSRRKRRKGLDSRSILDGLAVPESVDVEFAAPLPTSGDEEHEGATSGFRLRSDEDSDTSPLNVITAAEAMNIAIPTQDDRDPAQLLTAQALEFKRDKIELKKRKLEFLKQQHSEHMALLQRRMELEEQRARDESAARRSEWAALLVALRGISEAGGPSLTAEETRNL